MDKKMKSIVKDPNPEPSTDISTIETDRHSAHAEICCNASPITYPEFPKELLESLSCITSSRPKALSPRIVSGNLKTAADSVREPSSLSPPLRKKSIVHVPVLPSRLVESIEYHHHWSSGGGSYSSSSSSFSSLSSNLNNTSTTAFPWTASPTRRPETESFTLNNSSESEPPNETLSGTKAIFVPIIYPAGEVVVDINHLLRGSNVEQKKSAVIQENSWKFLTLGEIFLGLTGEAAISLMAYAPPMEASTSSSSAPPPPNARLYIIVATNAIAFVFCFISILLQNRKPAVAKIMEAIGSVVAAVAFFFMMATFLPV